MNFSRGHSNQDNSTSTTRCHSDSSTSHLLHHTRTTFPMSHCITITLPHMHIIPQPISLPHLHLIFTHIKAAHSLPLSAKSCLASLTFPSDFLVFSVPDLWIVYTDSAACPRHLLVSVIDSGYPYIPDAVTDHCLSDHSHH